MKIGIAFGDHIKTGKIPKRHYSEDSTEKVHRMRGGILFILLIAVIGILLTKLVILQIFQGSYYRMLSDSNRIRTKVIHAPRGVIFDRNGTALVFNLPGFRKTVNNKSELVSRDQALSMIAKGEQHLEVDTLRQYPFKDIFAHVVGYVGQISPEQLKTPDFASYGPNDFVGKSGVEKEYEKVLRGVDGKQLIEVDAVGQPVRTLGQTDPIPGQNITLTVDAKLQEAAYAAMKDVKRGAVIISTPKGEILSLISKPSYDPNLFTLDSTYKTATDAAYQHVSDILLDGQNQPLLDRAISGLYPPGSTFKLVAAAAGLEDHVIDKNFHITDTGILKLGTFSFANWYYTDYGKTDGEVNITKAIARSNDIFFYKLAEMIGVDRLSAFARKFGLGEKLGIDLSGEEAGTVPTTEWKKKEIGEQWYLGDTYHYGIGQGYLLTTPLQVNAWTQAIANGGTLYQPHLLKNGNFGVLSSNILHDNSFEIIREGMIEACNTGGVAWPFFNFAVKNKNLQVDNKNILSVNVASSSAQASGSAQLVSADMRHVVIACKTGTAQHGGEDTQPHSWITLFAPAYNPQIIVTVLAEDSGEGSNVAGPIAKQIVDYYFSQH